MNMDTMAWVAVAALPVDNRVVLQKMKDPFITTSRHYVAQSLEWFNTIAISGEEDELLNLWDRKDTISDATLQTT